MTNRSNVGYDGRSKQQNYVYLGVSENHLLPDFQAHPHGTPDGPIF